KDLIVPTGGHDLRRTRFPSSRVGKGLFDAAAHTMNQHQIAILARRLKRRRGATLDGAQVLPRCVGRHGVEIDRATRSSVAAGKMRICGTNDDAEGVLIETGAEGCDSGGCKVDVAHLGIERVAPVCADEVAATGGVEREQNREAVGWLRNRGGKR